MAPTADRRLHAALRHLAPASATTTEAASSAAAAAAAAGAPVLAEIVLGDSPRQWASAGFCIGPADLCVPAGHPDRSADGVQQAVRLGNVRVLLTGTGGPGLQSLGFTGLSAAAAAAVTERLPVGVSCHVAAAVPDTTVLNHNSVESLAELVLFASDLQGFVDALADGAGIRTNKGYPPRPMKGTPFATAQYFLQPQLRCLVVGPASPATTDDEAR
jgi:hypothetical protein